MKLQYRFAGGRRDICVVDGARTAEDTAPRSQDAPSRPRTFIRPAHDLHGEPCDILGESVDLCESLAIRMWP
jgi:hypothetical protein